MGRYPVCACAKKNIFLQSHHNGFSIARLVITQPYVLPINLSLTAQQIFLLIPFLNIGTMVNGLYTIHLATASEKIQDERKILFYSVFATTLSIAFLSLYLDRQLIQGIALPIIVSVLFIILYDFVRTTRQSKDARIIFVLRHLIVMVVATTCAINLFSYFFSASQIVQDLKVHNLAFFAFIAAGVLIIHMVTIKDQTTSDKHSIAASNALEVAANETALRQNQQRFLSMLMHEIRTPLSVIKIGADAITKSNHPNDSKSIWTQRIDTAIDNIAQVIDNCVQAEKQESGLIQPSLQKYVIKNEIESLYRQYLSANSELETRIKFDVDIEETATIHTDINYVRSILLNLISNAYKYSPPFSFIFVRLYMSKDSHGHAIVFEVENSLDKVEPPDPKQVFQRYYRSESAKKFSGTGVGLWLSQALAQQIGSRIDMKMTEQKTSSFSSV